MAVLACGGGAPHSSGPLPAAAEPLQHVILITVDTWRADHFLTTRGGVFLTPNLARWAEKSIRFAANSSVSTLTSAGVAGLFTGLLPHRSGVIVNEHTLSPALPTLATILRQAGFVTAGFVANPVIAPGFGFGNGFDHYEHVGQKHPYWKTKAAQVNRRVLEWLDQQDDPIEHLFLWLHYMEPHGPYEPDEEFTRLFAVESFDGAPTDIPLLPEGDHSGWQGVPDYQRFGSGVATGDGRVYLLRYAAEVRQLDEELGRLLEALNARLPLDRSVLAIAADHGEALAGDHGFYFSHDNGLTEDQIHVPLMLSYPGCDAGESVERPTSNVDLLPTILRLLDMDPPAEVDGIDLLRDEPRYVASETWRERSVRRGRFKLRLIRAERTLTLVDLAQDPGETVDLSATRPEIWSELRQQLKELRERPRLAEPLTRGAPGAEEAARLRALGYL